MCFYDSEGNMMEEVDKIGKVCEEYYKNMYAPEELLEVVFSMFQEIEPRYTKDEEMANNMIEEVTREEIYCMLMLIGD